MRGSRDGSLGPRTRQARGPLANGSVDVAEAGWGKDSILDIVSSDLGFDKLERDGCGWRGHEKAALRDRLTRLSQG